MKKSLYDLTVAEFTLSILYDSGCGEYPQTPYSKTETIEYLNKATHGFNPLFVEAVYGDMLDAKLTYEINHFDELSCWWVDREILTTDIGGKDVCVYMGSEDGIIRDMETGEECEWLIRKHGYDYRLKYPGEPCDTDLSPFETFAIRQQLFYSWIFGEILKDYLFINLSPLYDFAIGILRGRGTVGTPHVADSLQPTANDEVEASTILPDEIETTEAKKYINKAMELGLIPDALVKGVYGWNGNKKELVLFCELLSEACGWKNRKWKVGEQAFGVMRLAQSRKKAEYDGKFGKNEKAIKNMFKK